jgi:hypothetical protein
MVKDSYPTAKLKAPLTRQGAEQLQFVEEIARKHSNTEYRPDIRALLMFAMAEGVGNNEL